MKIELGKGKLFVVLGENRSWLTRTQMRMYLPSECSTKIAYDYTGGVSATTFVDHLAPCKALHRAAFLTPLLLGAILIVVEDDFSLSKAISTTLTGLVFELVQGACSKSPVTPRAAGAFPRGYWEATSLLFLGTSSAQEKP